MKLTCLIFSIFIVHSSFAQCGNLSNHPKGAEYGLRLYNDFKTFYSNNKFEKALPLWKELFEMSITHGLLIQGEKMSDHFIKKAQTDQERSHFHKMKEDILLRRLECFGDTIRKTTGLPYKGYTYEKLTKLYFFELKDYKKVVETAELALFYEGCQASEAMYSLYALAATNLKKEEKIDDQELQILQERVTIFLDDCVVIDMKNEANYFNLKQKVRDIFQPAIIDYFDCDFISKKIRSDYLKHKNDKFYVIDTILSLLIQFNCTLKDTLVKEVLKDFDYQSLYIRDCGFDPPREIDFEDIYFYLSREIRLQSKIEQYLADSSDNPILQKKFYAAAMRLADFNQAQEKWQDALIFYQKAALLHPNSGQPYIKIGMLCMRANRKCLGIERQKVAYLAIDYFKKASTFEDTKEEGRTKAIEYQQYLASQPDFIPKKKVKTTVGCILKGETFIPN